MKKLIIIMALFSLMIAASLGEIAFTTKFYTQTCDRLIILESSMKDNKENLNNADTLAKLKDTEEFWHSGKDFLMMIGHHMTVRNADEKIVSLGEYIRQNQQYDAFVSYEQVFHYIDDLKTDNHPTITNLF